MVIAGLTNKLISAKLGIKVNTVEFHRANVMKKLYIKTFSDVVELNRLVKIPAWGKVKSIQLISQRLLRGQVSTAG